MISTRCEWNKSYSPAVSFATFMWVFSQESWNSSYTTYAKRKKICNLLHNSFVFFLLFFFVEGRSRDLRSHKYTFAVCSLPAKNCNFANLSEKVTCRQEVSDYSHFACSKTILDFFFYIRDTREANAKWENTENNHFATGMM